MNERFTLNLVLVLSFTSVGLKQNKSNVFYPLYRASYNWIPCSCSDPRHWIHVASCQVFSSSCKVLVCIHSQYSWGCHQARLRLSCILPQKMMVLLLRKVLGMRIKSKAFTIQLNGCLRRMEAEISGDRVNGYK